MNTQKPKTVGRMLWAVRNSNEDWQEEIITTDATRIEAARTWAEQNGFGRFRVADITDEAPNFKKCLIQ